MTKKTNPTPTMENFNQIKTDFIQRCKNASACEPEFKRVLASETPEQLIAVVKDNIEWCMKNGVTNIEWFEQFGAEWLLNADIYITGKHNIKIESGSRSIVTWGSSSATVETWGSSSATVVTWDSSSATVVTWGSSSATVVTWDSSSATVKTWDSSSATVETWDSSSATVKTWGSSSATYSLGNGTMNTIKDLNKKQLHVKKDAFTIVTHD